MNGFVIACLIIGIGCLLAVFIGIALEDDNKKTSTSSQRPSTPTPLQREILQHDAERKRAKAEFQATKGVKIKLLAHNIWRDIEFRLKNAKVEVKNGRKYVEIDFYTHIYFKENCLETYFRNRCVYVENEEDIKKLLAELDFYCRQNNVISFHREKGNEYRGLAIGYESIGGTLRLYL